MIAAAVLGPVDPQLGGMPAAALVRVACKKPIPISTGLPREAYDLMDLFAQEGRRRPSVQYAPLLRPPVQTPRAGRPRLGTPDGGGPAARPHLSTSRRRAGT